MCVLLIKACSQNYHKRLSPVDNQSTIFAQKTECIKIIINGQEKRLRNYYFFKYWLANLSNDEVMNAQSLPRTTLYGISYKASSFNKNMVYCLFYD